MKSSSSSKKVFFTDEYINKVKNNFIKKYPLNINNSIINIYNKEIAIIQNSDLLKEYILFFLVNYGIPKINHFLYNAWYNTQNIDNYYVDYLWLYYKYTLKAVLKYNIDRWYTFHTYYRYYIRKIIYEYAIKTKKQSKDIYLNFNIM